MESKDKFKITATIRGNEIECGFSMPEGLNWDEYEDLFIKRFTKCVEAFGKGLEKIKDGESHDKDLEQ